jgi:chorismate lyase/3-hydroxybenzoate synthase
LRQGIDVQYKGPGQEILTPAAAEHYPFAQIVFGHSVDAHADAPLRVTVDLPQLQSDWCLETWSSATPVQHADIKRVRCAWNPQMLFGYTEAEEAADSVLEDLTYALYQRVFEQSRALGYPHLLRIWNYFPQINQMAGGLERYQQFCVGRHRAFAEQRGDFQSYVPAASAVGTRSGPLQVYFVAAKTPGLPLENPRQVRAYDYPPTYSPKSPTFARAMLETFDGGQRLFVAGTASIVGHASQHLGDPYAQTHETLANIDAVIRQTGWDRHRADITGRMKVYVRHAQDLPIIQSALAEHLGANADGMFLLGDICRADLLLEIEAILTCRDRTVQA